MKSLSKLYSSVPLIIIGYILLKLNFTGGDNYGGGVGEALLTAMGILMYAIVLAVILIWNTVAYYKSKKKFNPMPLFTTAILFLLFLLACNWSNIVRYKTTLYAKNKFHNNISIALKEKNRFEIKLHSIIYMNIYRGTYALSHDTLIFQRDVFRLTDSLVNNKYFVDTSKRILYPVEQGRISSDSTKYFTIGTETQD